MSLRALFIATVVATVCALSCSALSTTFSEVIERITSEGYPAESHQVTTADGYILGMHRIPHGKVNPSGARRPIVFVMHGLMGASSNFISLGKKNSIAYNLADAGFDVWLGNARGNTFSRQHVSLDPDDDKQKQKFFDYSFEEIAIIDISTMVDYALTISGELKLHYVGHSQGGTSFLVLNSVIPEYNDKFASAHLLAGVGYMKHFPNGKLRAAAQMTTVIYNLRKRLGWVEIKTFDDLLADRYGPEHGNGDCSDDNTHNAYCNMVGLDRILGHDKEDWSAGGSSLKQFAHFGQNIRDQAFRRWDYGLFSNRKYYGTLVPPSFDLSLVDVPTIMHYTVNDEVLNEQDVLDMVHDLPKAIARKIARETFSHADFLHSADVKELVTDYIIESINHVESLARL